MVFSSIIAAWADVQHASVVAPPRARRHVDAHAGYAWMFANVATTSAFVLSMRKVIKKMNFKDWDSESNLP